MDRSGRAEGRSRPPRLGPVVGASGQSAQTWRRQSAQTWRRIARELERLHLVTLQGPAGTIEQTTQLTDTQRAIYAATGVQSPPRVTALKPA